MKLGVVGSRSITSRHTVEKTLIESPWCWTDTIVSGGADGVDSVAEDIADRRDIDTIVKQPDFSDWSGEHPCKARNTEIVKESDAIVAIWGGNSPGTRDTIDKALARSVPIYVEVIE